ncbi:MAG: hypothetical protein HYW24_02275 [Candidatus Aenigmarchaeota archaeon]|nr:hypothetical protein [Candidatus Aenigmarchaeota archaeon]
MPDQYEPEENNSISYEQFENFINSIPDRIKSIDNLMKDGVKNGAWDTELRNRFFKFVIKWFCEDFRVKEDIARNYIFVEGINRIPESFRSIQFFKSPMNPDAAFIFDDKLKVAIELDHGYKGSQIRNALTKASFSVLLGIFQKSILFFFQESSEQCNITDNEKRVLETFEADFSTKLYII